MKHHHITLCEHCIEEIKSRGEIVYVGNRIDEDCDTALICEWCDDESIELFDCHF